MQAVLNELKRRKVNPMSQPTAQQVQSCVERCEQKTSPGGTIYYQPPQCGGTIYDGLPLWRLVSSELGFPIAKNFGDGQYYVVTSTTSAEELKGIYDAAGGDEAFEKALSAATS